jgi:hypothetical protein
MQNIILSNDHSFKNATALNYDTTLSFIKNELNLEPLKIVSKKYRKNADLKNQIGQKLFLFDLKSNNAEKIQFYLRNSNCGDLSVRIGCAIFRIACSNGLIIKSDILPEMSIRHTDKNFNNNVFDAIYTIKNKADHVTDLIEKYKSISVDENISESFSNKILDLRMNDKYSLINGPSNIRRNEDKSSDLWTVFNIAQENLIRGTNNVLVFNNESKERELITLRKITGLHSELELNKSAWELLEKEYSLIA